MSTGAPAAHITAMSIDRILASVEITRAELDSTVAQQRKFTAEYQMVLADHFPVEDFAVAIEQLAGRLQDVLDLTVPHLKVEGPVGDLARALHQAVLPATADAALQVVRDIFGAEPEGTLSSGIEAVFGRSGTHLVVRLIADPDSPTPYRHELFAVHLPTGHAVKAERPETKTELVARLAALTEG